MAAHTVNKLTAIFVKKAKEPGKYGDGNGLFLHVKLSGAKHWVQRLTVNGKRRDIGLGHGMFSYFLMKGMEGEADANNDNEITAGELHAYVEQNVVQQSSGSQTPELQGDASRVLVQF